MLEKYPPEVTFRPFGGGFVSRLAELEWLRNTLRESIAIVDPDKVAPLANQYRAVLAEIEDLAPAPVAENVSPIEEARRRREARMKA